jgi:competence protein ComEC
VQEGGSFFRKLAQDLASIAGVDSRPLLFAFAMCAGAGIYLSAPFEPTLLEVWGLLAAALTVLLVVRWLHRSDLTYAITICVFGLVLGFSAGAIRARLVQAPVIGTETRPVMLEGWVANIEAGEKGARLKIKVHSIAGFGAEELPELVRVTHRARMEVSSGRFVRCWVVLRPPPSPTLPGDYDFRRQAYFQKLGAVGYVQGRCRGGVLGAPAAASEKLGLWIAAQRRQMAVYVNEAAGERAGGLAAALVTGDRSFLRQEDQVALRDTGLAHLLAISGLHLSIVGGLTFFLVRRVLVLIEPLALRVPVQKIAAVVALMTCAAYLVISGASVSTQRAFIMAAIVFLAVIFDRAAISLRTFAIALIAVVLLQPESVVSPGFQMSFAATGGLIAAYEVWRNHRSSREKVLGPIGFAWASIIMTSVVSDAATAPFSFFHFERLSPVGLFANFAIMPVVTFITAPAAALTVVLAIFGHADLGLELLGQSLELVLSMTHYFYNLSPGVVRMSVPMPPMALVFVALSLAAMMAFAGWARLIGGIVLMAPAIWLWSEAPRVILHWSVSGDVFIADQDGMVHRLELADGDGLAPLRFSEVPDAAPCGLEKCLYSSFGGLNVKTTGKANDDKQDTEEATSDLAIHVLGEDVHGSELQFSWADVKEAGGITVYSQDGQLSVVQLQNCTGRPWRRCSDDNKPLTPQGGMITYIKSAIRNAE